MSAGGFSLPAGASRHLAIRLLSEAFKIAGVEAASQDARALVRFAANLSATELIADSSQPLGAAAQTRLALMARRRMAGEPVTRIIGRREFWGLSLAVTDAVLDPRPDTETLVEASLRTLGARRDTPLRFLDLGAGSGALLCALLSACPQAIGLGVDLSPAAAAVASANLATLGLAGRGGMIVGDWARAAAPGFDLIVSNPPYIATADIATLDAEVRLHDPRLALDGGTSGFDAYRALALSVGAALAPQGALCVEAGAGQAADISEIFAAQGFATIAMDRDLGGHLRCLTFRTR